MLEIRKKIKPNPNDNHLSEREREIYYKELSHKMIMETVKS